MYLQGVPLVLKFSTNKILFFPSYKKRQNVIPDEFERKDEILLVEISNFNIIIMKGHFGTVPNTTDIVFFTGSVLTCKLSRILFERF